MLGGNSTKSGEYRGFEIHKEEDTLINYVWFFSSEQGLRLFPAEAC